MSYAEYLDVAVRILLVGLFCYAIVAMVVKPIVKRLGGSFAKTQIRSAAVVFGCVFGVIPGVWPEWMPLIWGLACGGIGGSFAIVGHHAVALAIPKAVDKAVDSIPGDDK